MSALALLLGGVLFLAVHYFAGTLGVAVVALVLFGWELIHDLGLYRKSKEVGSEMIEGLNVALLTPMVEAELHRVQCMDAKHRSRFTGQCRSAANVARGLFARLEQDRKPDRGVER